MTSADTRQGKGDHKQGDRKHGDRSKSDRPRDHKPHSKYTAGGEAPGLSRGLMDAEQYNSRAFFRSRSG